jgi:hypothetical protein
VQIQFLGQLAGLPLETILNAHVSCTCSTGTPTKPPTWAFAQHGAGPLVALPVFTAGEFVVVELLVMVGLGSPSFRITLTAAPIPRDATIMAPKTIASTANDSSASLLRHPACCATEF